MIAEMGSHHVHRLGGGSALRLHQLIGVLQIEMRGEQRPRAIGGETTLNRQGGGSMVADVRILRSPGGGTHG